MLRSSALEPLQILSSYVNEAGAVGSKPVTGHEFPGPENLALRPTPNNYDIMV